MNKFNFNSIINEEIHRIRNSNVFYDDFQSLMLEGDEIDNTTEEGQKDTIVAKERILQLLDETIKLMAEEYKNITSIENADPSHTALGAKVDTLVEFLKDQKRAISKIRFDL